MSLRQTWRIIAQSFRTAYEYIGILMLANVVWFFVALFPLLIVAFLQITNVTLLAIGIIGTLVLIGPATAGIHFMINKLVHKEDTTIVDFKVGFGKYFGKSILLVLLNLVIVVILVFDLVFSINNPNTFIRLLSGIWIYFILFWVVFVQYLFPFLVQQNRPVFTIFKRAALVALDNVVVSLLIACAVVVVGLVSILLAAPVLLFTMGLVAFIQNFALAEVLKKYNDGNGIE